MTTEEIKVAVGRAAAERYVRSGMKIGLGTGSTAIHAVRRIGEMLADGTLQNVVGVPTSFDTRIEAQRVGIPVRELNDTDIDGRLDLAIDGADEVEQRSWFLIKGGGAALTLEKTVEYATDRVVIVVDPGKVSDRLGSIYPVPLEVLPFARLTVERAVRRFDARPELRRATRKAGPVITDNGNILLDLHFDSAFDAVALERELNRLPGVVENGIFTGFTPVVLVGRADGSVETLNE